MKSIDQIARKPQLTEITLDSEDIISQFGDSVIFWIPEFIDIKTYFRYFQTLNEEKENISEILEMLVLDQQGQKALADGRSIPAGLAIAIIQKINEHLGKSETKSLMKSDGNQVI